MKRTIAIDAMGISRPGGGRSATLNVLRELLDQDRDSLYLLLLDQEEPDLALGDHVEQIITPIKHRLLSRLWGQIVWPFMLRRRQVDLVHHIKNLTTLWLPGKSAVTLYDLTIVLHPEIYPWTDVVYWRHAQPYMLSRVDRLVAISLETKNDLIRAYGLPEDRIEVIYPAYNPIFAPANEAHKLRVRETYGLGEQFLLHVGSLSQKKNLLNLLIAFEQLCHRGYEGNLVFVGRRYGKGQDDAFEGHLAASRYADRVVLTGAVPLEDLPAINSAAEVMVFPSRHEGFGIVPLEAMACGTPVVTSSEGALPEVVGQGGILVRDAQDPKQIADAVEPLLRDRRLHDQWAQRGLVWTRRYSTDTAARQTLRMYERLLMDREQTD